MTNEVKGGGSDVFKYEHLDASTAEFLRIKEINMREIAGKARTELGRELSEARDILANNKNGVFGKWLDYIGVERRQATRLINRYDLVIGTKCPNIIEDLPISLSYDISAPSAESTPEKAQAKAEVLAGEISTGKAYKERIKELEERAKQAEAQAELSQRSEENMRRQLEESESGTPEVEQEYENEQDRTLRTPHDVDKLIALQKFMDGVELLYKDYGWAVSDVENMRDFIECDPDLQDIFRTVDSSWDKVRNTFYGSGNERTIIEVLNN